VVASYLAALAAFPFRPNQGRRVPFSPIGPAHDPGSLYPQMQAFLT